MNDLRMKLLAKILFTLFAAWAFMCGFILLNQPYHNVFYFRTSNVESNQQFEFELMKGYYYFRMPENKLSQHSYSRIEQSSLGPIKIDIAGTPYELQPRDELGLWAASDRTSVTVTMPEFSSGRSGMSFELVGGINQFKRLGNALSDAWKGSPKE